MSLNIMKHFFFPLFASIVLILLGGFFTPVSAFSTSTMSTDGTNRLFQYCENGASAYADNLFPCDGNTSRDAHFGTYDNGGIRPGMFWNFSSTTPLSGSYMVNILTRVNTSTIDDFETMYIYRINDSAISVAGTGCNASFSSPKFNLTQVGTTTFSSIDSIIGITEGNSPLIYGTSFNYTFGTSSNQGFYLTGIAGWNGWTCGNSLDGSSPFGSLHTMDTFLGIQYTPPQAVLSGNPLSSILYTPNLTITGLAFASSTCADASYIVSLANFDFDVGRTTCVVTGFLFVPSEASFQNVLDAKDSLYDVFPLSIYSQMQAIASSSALATGTLTTLSMPLPFPGATSSWVYLSASTTQAFFTPTLLATFTALVSASLTLTWFFYIYRRVQNPILWQD